MARAGIGVDIVEIARMESILKRTPSFATRVFTDEERAYCESSNRPAAHYACRFAAREAVLKALGTGFSSGIGRRDVSVSRDAFGKPVAVLNGRALEIAQDLGIVEVAISLSFTNDVAVANAMTITEDARPKQKPDRESEKARIARSFREAKSVLEELERVQDAELVSISGESQITEMKPVLSTEEVRRLEDLIEKEGTSKAELMELAGEFVASLAEARSPKSVLVLCGFGNNGGDGWVAADILSQKGSDVHVVTR